MASFERVALIHPKYPAEYDFHILPVGLGYISEALLRAGISNTVIDMQLGYDLVAARRRLEEFGPDLVGLSMMSFGFMHHYRLLEKIKQWFPRVRIIVGGPHMVMGEQVLQECSVIDYGVVGEGEEPVVELCRGERPPSEIQGLVYRDGRGEVACSGKRPLIADLDANGFPSFSQFELDKYDNRLAHVATSRGCPCQCIFCAAGNTKVRLRSPSSVADEFENWYAKGYRDFRIVDDNFTIRAERVFGICDELESRGLTGLNIECANGIRADRVTRDMLSRMKEVGFSFLSFGVEGGTNEVLKRLRKGETIETIELAVQNACELGYMVALFFLIGSPGETEADVRRSVSLARKHAICGARFYNIIPFPRTQLYDWVDENDLFVREPKEYLANAAHWVNEPFFETPELSVEKRKKLVRWANRTVAYHTLKVKKKFHRQGTLARLQAMGVPPVLRRLLADLYFTRFGQLIFRDTGFVRGLKRIFSNEHSGLRQAVSHKSVWDASESRDIS